MNELTKLIRSDMVPALGVTEPGAIAFSVATARKYAPGKIISIKVRLNSGMYKNGYTCGIPNSARVGNMYSAALGAVAGDPDKKLESLSGVTHEDDRAAEELVASGAVTVEMSGMTSRIFIQAQVIAEGADGGQDEATVTIRDSHTNIVSITKNGKKLFQKPGYDGEEEEKDESAVHAEETAPLIHRYRLKELVDYAENVDPEEISFIREAYRVNMELFEYGLKSPRTVFAHQLLKLNGGEVFSEDEELTASLLCNGAIEARVLGLDRPAMSITGSGAHGIIATLPLYGAYKTRGYSEEMLLRATALSYLVCMYIKEYSGKLSAFCGCAIAAGTGMACGLTMMRGGDAEDMEKVINNMASSITGMICDGGNHGCVMKGVAAVETVWRSVELGMNGASVEWQHGINGRSPEETMRNMGLIASPGMVGTENTIVEIMKSK
ncbi:serine dehydratase subunit alpha family protein [Mobilibacterium timonense]|uniref:L-cysteine desulfidase family protein n=1 Tax=Mobilibacterium timonense TaxID=1871012 RepID=UPI000987896C|nr:L-serine ammonia-lyase, iron-sulfur-dependent, subunit alpha [Mobilibacterium timonense]MBM6990661.1 serine dehydratase subunit alpha family protein [Mobilibacterium timonense]